MWSEDGLAKRTLEAYRRDLEGLAKWLAGRGRNLRDARREDISAYHGLYQRRALDGAAAIDISSLLRLRRARPPNFIDPTLRIERPRMPRSLPKALAEREVESLLAAPDVDTALACATAPCWN